MARAYRGALRTGAAAAVAAAMAMSGCTATDYYDHNFMQQQAQANFPVPIDKIDPTHTWETMRLTRARLTMPATAPDSVWLYAGNPFGASGEGKLLAKRALRAGSNVFDFDRPATATHIFMLTRDDAGRATAVADTLGADETLAHDFTAATRATLRPTTRAIDYDYGWTPATVSASDATLFPATAPQGATPLPATYDYYTFVAEGGDYVVNASTTAINCSNAAHFYVQGDVTLTGIYFGGNATGTITLLPGSRLTMSGLALGINTTLAICPGATLDCGSGTLQFSNACQGIYNAGAITCGKLLSSTQRELHNLGTITVGGEGANITDLRLYNAPTATITATTLDINNESKVINDGTITTSGQLATKNNNSLLANRAAISAASFATEGSSRFINEDTGTTNIDGLSLVNSNTCTWVNSGHFTTRTMTFNATSENWLNRCHLDVTELLTIELGGGYLYVDGGGFVRCARLYMNNAKVVLGSKAYFLVTDTATFGYHGYNPWWTQGHQGFFGTGEEAALVRIARAVKGAEGTYPCINFFDNVQVTTEGFAFPQQVDEWNVNYHLDGGAAAVSSNGGTATIDGTCGEAYTPEPETDIPAETQAYTYLFEDMTEVAGDYDFNDCVASVTTPIDGALTLTLWAAGCTKTLDLCLKATAGNSDNIRVLVADVGRAFTTPAGQKSDGYIVNTETQAMSPGEIYCRPVTVRVDNLPEGFTLTANGDFFITDAHGQVHIPAFTDGFHAGDVPYALRVPGSWQWPVEYIPVTSVYFGFEQWARNATAETNWWASGYADGYVFDKSLLPE